MLLITSKLLGSLFQYDIVLIMQNVLAGSAPRLRQSNQIVMLEEVWTSCNCS